MTTFGGYAPFPIRFGGTRVLKTLTDALGEARGTAYDVSDTSPVWVENHAVARALAGVWATNERLSKLRDLRRTSALARWEAIYRISPPAGATDHERRQALLDVAARRGLVPTPQQIQDGLARILSPATCSVTRREWNDSNAVASHPAAWYVQADKPSAPVVSLRGNVTEDIAVLVAITQGGARGVATAVVSWTTPTGGESFTIATPPLTALWTTGLSIGFGNGTYEENTHYTARAYAAGWTSRVAELDVVTSLPSDMSKRDYDEAVGRAHVYLDAALPAWMSFTITRGDYFRLDTPANLDGARLR